MPDEAVTTLDIKTTTDVEKYVFCVGRLLVLWVVELFDLNINKVNEISLHTVKKYPQMYKHSSRKIFQSQLSHYLGKHLKVRPKVQRG